MNIELLKKYVIDLSSIKLNELIIERQDLKDILANFNSDIFCLDKSQINQRLLEIDIEIKILEEKIFLNSAYLKYFNKIC